MKILKFGADWCPGCMLMKPRFAKIEQENTWLKTEFFDADKDKSEHEKYQIKKLPSFIFFDKNNVEIERLEGIVPEKKIIELINKYQDK